MNLMTSFTVAVLVTTTIASLCRNKSELRVLRKLRRKQLFMFKQHPHSRTASQSNSCNRLRLSNYTKRCPTVMKTSYEGDRIPRLLSYAVCKKCNPECCAVTYWIQVLKKLPKRQNTALDIWELRQEQIAVAYAKP